MRKLPFILVCIAAASAQEVQKVQETEPAVSPQPVTESPDWQVEFGYRARTDIGGNFSAYRSVVNLGEGPKLLHLDLSVPATGNLFDRLELRADSWGGEPYNTASLRVERSNIYRLNVRYRNLALFNQLPSFALGRQASDLRRRGSDVDLELLPGRAVVPYFGWSVDSGTGAGLTHFVTQGNEFAVAGSLSDRTDLFRGGVRLENRRWHVTLEQGVTRFRQDDALSDSGLNTGNRPTPLLGQLITLDRLNQDYRIRGRTLYSKAVLTASPSSWLDLSGNFLYSRPAVESSYTADAAGRFIDLDALVFSNALRGLTRTDAKQPHTSGVAAAEIRPHDRIRIVETWMTDRLHNASGGSIRDTLPMPVETLLADRLAWNWNQQQLEGFLDVTRGLTVHGGHRYIWGDAAARLPQTLGGPPEARVRRHVGLAGVILRPAPSLRLLADFEGSPGDRSFFRTSLQDYRKFRMQARWQPLTTLTLHGNANLLDNRNPSSLGELNLLSRSTSLGLVWTPTRLNGVVLSGDYARTSVRNDIDFLDLPFLRPAQSRFRENAHIANGLLEWRGSRVRIGGGGSMFVSSGSRPTQLYQPVGQVEVPLYQRVSAKAEWRWHGLAEPFYTFEGFRAHLWMFSLRVRGK